MTAPEEASEAAKKIKAWLEAEILAAKGSEYKRFAVCEADADMETVIAFIDSHASAPGYDREAAGKALFEAHNEECLRLGVSIRSWEDITSAERAEWMADADIHIKPLFEGGSDDPR